DLGATVPEGLLRWTEADLAFDLALRLEGRLGAAGMRVYLTRGPSPEHELTDQERAQLANDLGADLFISLHIDRHPNPDARGVAAVQRMGFPVEEDVPTGSIDVSSIRAAVGATTA